MQDLFKKVIDDALWAPTPDNIQNWSITLLENSFEVEIRQMPEHHPLDKNYHASIISLGGLSQYIKISAAHYGYSAKINFFNETQLKIQVCLEKSTTPSQTLIGLYPYLKTRRTDRRAYIKSAVAESVKSELLASNELFSSQVSFSEKPESTFYKYLSMTEKIFWKQINVLMATLKWINFGREIPKSGLSYQNAGLSKGEAIFLNLVKNNYHLLKLVMQFGVAKINRIKINRVYKNSNGFLLFTAKDPTYPSLFEAGAQAIHCWLILTKFGLTAQPLTLSSLSCFDLHKSGPQLKHVNKNKRHFHDGIELLKKTFSAEESRVPCWLLRIGESTPFPKKMIPSRFQAEDLAVNKQTRIGARAWDNKSIDF